MSCAAATTVLSSPIRDERRVFINNGEVQEMVLGYQQKMTSNGLSKLY